MEASSPGTAAPGGAAAGSFLEDIVMLSTSWTYRGPIAGRRMWISFFVCLGLVVPTWAQQPPANLPPIDKAGPPVAAPAPATPHVSNLDECIAMAMTRQPALTAARASLAAAESGKRG